MTTVSSSSSSNANNASGDDSPSYARRQALRQADSATLKSLTVLDTNPITKYVEMSVRLLDAFQLAVDSRNLNEAYVYGMRFATFSLQVLPTHKDWKHKSKCLKDKRRNRQQVDKVLSMMEIIKQRMDVEEIIIAQQHQEQQKEKERQKLEKQQRQIEEEQEKERKIKESLEKQRKELRQKEQNERSDEQASIESQEEKKATNRSSNEATKPKHNRDEEKEAIERSAMAKLLAFGKTLSTSKPTCMSPSTTTTTTTSCTGVETAPMKQPSKKSSTTAGTKTKQVKVPVVSSSSKVEHSQSHRPTPQSKKQTLSPTRQTTKSIKKQDDESKATKIHSSSQSVASSKKAVIQPENVKSKATKDHSSSQNVAPSTKTVSQPETSKVQPKSNDAAPTVVLPPPVVQQKRQRPKTEEELVIERLQKAIEAQERRLVEIDDVHIPALLKQAKDYLALDKQDSSTNQSKSGDTKEDKRRKEKSSTPMSKNRQAALKCMKHKKRLENESDTIKAAIFHMETQVFMLENVMEDRQVKKAMDEAAKTMKSIQESVGGADVTQIATELSDSTVSLSSSLPSPGLSVDEFDDDEELMEELEELLSPGKNRSTSKRQSSQQLEKLILDAGQQNYDDDEISILSLPSIPKTPLAASTVSSSKSKTKNLIPAVF